LSLAPRTDRLAAFHYYPVAGVRENTRASSWTRDPAAAAAADELSSISAQWRLV